MLNIYNIYREIPNIMNIGNRKIKCVFQPTLKINKIISLSWFKQMILDLNANMNKGMSYSF